MRTMGGQAATVAGLAVELGWALGAVDHPVAGDAVEGDPGSVLRVTPPERVLAARARGLLGDLAAELPAVGRELEMTAALLDVSAADAWRSAGSPVREIYTGIAETLDQHSREAADGLRLGLLFAEITRPVANRAELAARVGGDAATDALALLGVLASHLPADSAAAVGGALGLWARRAERPDASAHLESGELVAWTRQRQVWRSLLTGQLEAATLLGRPELLDVAHATHSAQAASQERSVVARAQILTPVGVLALGLVVAALLLTRATATAVLITVVVVATVALTLWLIGSPDQELVAAARREARRRGLGRGACTAPRERHRAERVGLRPGPRPGPRDGAPPPPAGRGSAPAPPRPTGPPPVRPGEPLSPDPVPGPMSPPLPAEPTPDPFSPLPPEPEAPIPSPDPAGAPAAGRLPVGEPPTEAFRPLTVMEPRDSEETVVLRRLPPPDGGGSRWVPEDEPR